MKAKQKYVCPATVVVRPMAPFGNLLVGTTPPPIIPDPSIGDPGGAGEDGHLDGDFSAKGMDFTDRWDRFNDLWESD